MRVFIAVDLSDEAKKEIAKLLKQMAKKHWPVKWEKAEKLHQTLVFLGSLSERQLSLVFKACQKAVLGISPFEISFKGLGAFPSYDFVRIIWLGLKGDLKSLALVQKNLSQELKFAFTKTDKKTLDNLNFTLSKPFSPHITLGRIKTARTRERREIGRQLKRFRDLGLEISILVNKITIYESKLGPAGSIYNKLLEVPLK